MCLARLRLRLDETGGNVASRILSRTREIQRDPM